MFSVIFDMDGTMLDTQRIVISAWEYAGRNQGIKGVGNAVKNVCGMNQAGWSRYLKENYPKLEMKKFIAEMRQYIIDNLVVKFMPGAEELLKFLKKNGVKIAIASGSSRASVMHHLNEVSATDYFDAIVGGDEITNGKPAPDIFLLAAERLGVSPKACFVFEDSVSGIKSCNNAGMKSIGIPDISDISEDINALLFARLSRLDEAIPILEKLL